MKFFTLILVLALTVGFFLYGRSKTNPVVRNQDTLYSGSTNGGTGAYVESVNLESRQVYEILHAYLLTTKGRPTDQETSDDPVVYELRRQMDVLLLALPLGPNYASVVSTPLGERKGVLQSYLVEGNKDTMAYASISDTLNGTNLCEKFGERKQCEEQRSLLQALLKSQNIERSQIAFAKEKFVAVYATQSKLSMDQYIELVDELLKEHLGIKD